MHPVSAMIPLREARLSLRILNQDGDEVFFWTPGDDDA
jgi:hypothetical protein